MGPGGGHAARLHGRRLLRRAMGEQRDVPKAPVVSEHAVLPVPYLPLIGTYFIENVEQLEVEHVCHLSKIWLTFDIVAECLRLFSRISLGCIDSAPACARLTSRC